MGGVMASGTSPIKLAPLCKEKHWGVCRLAALWFCAGLSQRTEGLDQAFFLVSGKMKGEVPCLRILASALVRTVLLFCCLLRAYVHLIQRCELIYIAGGA